MLTCLMLGCSSSVSLIPVSGTVTLGKENLKTGSVAFYPDETKGNNQQHIPSGLITDGKYELFTNGSKGAPAGAYKVVVIAIDVDPSKKEATPPVPKSFIDVKYNDKTTTPLKAEVAVAAAPGAFDFQVSKK